VSIERIRKLRAMTTANGCSEAEAMAAAAKAAALMREMGLRDGDVEFSAEEASVQAGWNSQRSHLWATIAVCTNTATVHLPEGRIEYIGRAPWPEVAAYLHEVTNRAINRELGAFKRTSWYRRRRTMRTKREAAADFTLAMVARLSSKLVDLFRETISEALFADALAERDVRYATAPVKGRATRGGGRFLHARAAGWGAGASVELSHGVAGAAERKLVGKAA
jgi:hypothetical protein